MSGYGRTTEVGTSFAAPGVAGPAENLLSKPKYKCQLALGGKGSLAQSMKQLIESLTHPRVPGGPLMIWNGLDSVDEYSNACGTK